MIGWTELPSSDTETFLNRAAQFCNGQLWGDLSCLILVDSKTRCLMERKLAQTITELQYGTVALNIYAGLAFASGVTPCGSYLNGKADTGTGWVHNSFFFDKPEKTVMEGPFIPSTPQPWVQPFPNLYGVGQAMFELDLEPNLTHMSKFLKIFGKSFLLRKSYTATKV